MYDKILRGVFSLSPRCRRLAYAKYARPLSPCENKKARPQNSQTFGAKLLRFNKAEDAERLAPFKDDNTVKTQKLPPKAHCTLSIEGIFIRQLRLILLYSTPRGKGNRPFFRTYAKSQIHLRGHKAKGNGYTRRKDIRIKKRRGCARLFRLSKKSCFVIASKAKQSRERLTYWMAASLRSSQ
jgi:hypothetical protein